jgi:uncharacterized protein YoaH (UPF0181 family)
MAHTQRAFQAVRARFNGKTSMRSLHGKEYTVIPVGALVEGVLQGMGSEGPELALAEEFGKFPTSWDGRPVVMSHPTVEVDGKKTPVSANSPDILETYQIGYIFNTKLVGNELHQEAWVDNAVMESLNDDSKETMARLNSGEQIEVSTGYFALIEDSEGTYNNQDYEGVQRNIVPDHLAFLPDGTLGACSNADGCGAQIKANANAVIKLFRVEQPCCDSCASKTNEDPMPDANAKSKDPMDEDGKKKKKQDPKAYEQIQSTLANTIAGGVTLGDATKLVAEALRTQGGTTYCYVVAMTKDVVIYEMYDAFMSMYVMYQRSYSVSAEGKVTLGDEIQKVQLMTKVVTVNADGTPSSESTEQPMTTAASAAPGATAPAAEVTAQEKTFKVDNDAGSLEVTLNADGSPKSFAFTPKVNKATQPQTVEEYIASAPRAMQEVLTSAMQIHDDKKQGTIKALMDTKRCKFTEEQLKAMSLDQLENLAELANVPSYGGRAAPVSANASEDDAPPPAPLVFEVVNGGKKDAA